MHKAKMIIPALVVTMLALPAMAHEDEYYDSARVISVTPQTERVNYPVEECHTYRYNGRSYSSVTDRDPGDRSDVRVSVGPGRQGEEVAYYVPDYDAPRGPRHQRGFGHRY